MAKKQKEKFKVILISVGIFLILVGITLLITKSFLPEYVDEEGILHEKFYLIPLGFFFVFLGLVNVVVMFVVTFARNHNKKD